MISAVDRARKLILELCSQPGENLDKVSRAIGRSHAYLQQFVQRCTPYRLFERERIALGRYFNRDPNDFRSDDDYEPTIHSVNPEWHKIALEVALRTVQKIDAATIAAVVSRVYPHLAKRPKLPYDALVAIAESLIEELVVSVHQDPGGDKQD